MRPPSLVKASFLLLFVLCLGVAAEAQKIAPTVSDAGPDKIKTPPAAESTAGSMKVSFDEAASGVIYVEAANGERIRVDINKRSVESVKAPVKTAAPVPEPEATGSKALASAAETKKTKDEHAYDFDKGEEPYDYRVVNIPTAKHIPKGSWSISFTHRFSEPVAPVKDSAKDLFGLDSFAIPAFALYYGVTDKLYVEAQRSPLCQRGICRDVEVGVGYNWIAQNTKSHFGLTTYASIEGNDNFTEEYTYNLQVLLSARLGKRVFLFFDPAIHLKTNGQRRFDPRASDFFPPSQVAENFRLPVNGGSFGFGADVMITPTLLALFDFSPRVGFKLGALQPLFDRSFHVTGFDLDSHPSIGFGIQKNVGKHSFALTFSNTQTTTTSKYNSSSLDVTAKHVSIGFNISRRF